MAPQARWYSRAWTGEPASQDDTRIWAGRIGDPFYIDLDELAVIDAAIKKGTAPDFSGWRADKARNSFAGTTVESIVLEVSHQHPQLHRGTRAGVWVRDEACYRRGRLAADQPGRRFR